VTTAEVVVLDASALVAYARNEPGAQVVAAWLRSGARVLVSSVNWAETAGKLRDYQMTPMILRLALAAVDAEIVPFAESDADAVAELTPRVRPLGLSLGDRACIALALAVDAPALTAERGWTALVLPGLAIEQIR
jgi:PIN domain nuclease of toxin-antitoxin system